MLELLLNRPDRRKDKPGESSQGDDSESAEDSEDDGGDVEGSTDSAKKVKNDTIVGATQRRKYALLASGKGTRNFWRFVALERCAVFPFFFSF